MPPLTRLTTRLLAMASAVVLTLAAVAAEPPAADTRAFLERLKPLAQNRTVQADYTQTRHFQDLDYDLTVTGSMAQEQGKRLAWLTEKPLKTACLVSADSLRLWDAETNRTTTLNAAKYPWIKLIFDLQNSWMNGNADTLTKLFTIRPLNDTTLSLTPADPAVTLFFTAVNVTFTADFTAVASVRFTEKSGDTITIAFHNVRNNATIPPAVWELP